MTLHIALHLCKAANTHTVNDQEVPCACEQIDQCHILYSTSELGQCMCKHACTDVYHAEIG